MYDPHEIAAHTAHDAELLSLLVADRRVDWYRAEVRIAGERVPVPVALHWAAVKSAQGDREAAECVARDCLQAIERALLPWAQDEAERRVHEDAKAAREEERQLRDDDRGSA